MEGCRVCTRNQAAAKRWEVVMREAGLRFEQDLELAIRERDQDLKGLKYEDEVSIVSELRDQAVQNTRRL